MKEIINIEARLPYEPLSKNEEGAFCKCGKALVFDKSERNLHETVIIHCPLCGSTIFYG